MYRFGRGFGQDVISEWSSYRHTHDVIEFDATIAPDEVIVEESAGNLILRIAGTDDRITIERTMHDNNYRIESVRFADGTIWSHADLVTRALAASDADQVLNGSYDSELIDGGAGNDSIDGGEGNDVLIGGSGNDWLRGGRGDDVYRFGRGFGQDVISEWSSYRHTHDVIEFDATIAPDEVIVEESAGNLILRIAGPTTGSPSSARCTITTIASRASVLPTAPSGVMRIW